MKLVTTGASVKPNIPERIVNIGSMIVQMSRVKTVERAPTRLTDSSVSADQDLLVNF